ncbi:MAG: hypothetical protein ACLU3I_00380 [Acutalibacteraceae bacterium]
MILSMPGRGTANEHLLAVYGLGERRRPSPAPSPARNEAAQLTRAAKRRLFIDIPATGSC